MRQDTIVRKNATEAFKNISGKEWFAEKVLRVISEGKKAFDSIHLELGRMLAEAIMYMDREEISGPDYMPASANIHKWASQKGSIFIGDQKVRVDHPRVRGDGSEIGLGSYEKLKEKGAFSEQLLGKILLGLSANKYRETVVEASKAFGVSASSVSNRIIEATSKKLWRFKNRGLKDFAPFAIFIDTIHRGGEAFMVALGVDTKGNKLVLGFWQGATENHELCIALLSNLEKRGLKLSHTVIYITDGGKGVIKALRDKFGNKLLHVRCAIHKSRNIQKHLAKKYRKEANKRLMTALDQNSYTDAKTMLLGFQKWLRAINESAADSLLEALDELLTLHKLQIPKSLRKTLYSTNPIESMFSTVRDCENNIKRYRNNNMTQRWLGSVLLYCEKGFQKIKGCSDIAAIMAIIEQDYANDNTMNITA